MRLRLEAYAERLRGSLFALPAVYVAVAMASARATTWVDELFAGRLEGLPVILPATVASARAILSTIAAATITVAAIVFSVTMVSVQLSSSQFSPRVLRGFLRDRFQQHVIGLVVATFTYCLLVLAATRVREVGEEAAQPVPNLSVTLAIALAVVAILAIIGFIDHSARSLQVGETIRRITDETRQRVEDLHPNKTGGSPATHPPDVEAHAAPPQGEPDHTIRSTREGWVQQVDRERILDALPPAGAARLEAPPGDFVLVGTPLCAVWGDASDEERVRSCFAIGATRTLQQDVAFGIRQLVDIALRALSPSVNDPTTAYEAIASIASILVDLLQRDLIPTTVLGEDARVLHSPRELTHARYVRRSFDQIRVAAATQPTVGVLLIRTLGQVRDVLEAAGLHERIDPLERQAHLVVETVERARPTDHDLARVREAAAETGFVDA